MSDPAEGVTPITFRQLLPAIEEHFGHGGPLFVCDTCIANIDGESVAYRIPGASFGRPRTAEVLTGTLRPEKVPVEAVGSSADDYMQVLNWRFHRIKPSDLKNGDLLLNFRGLDPSALEGGVHLTRYEWAIRPGDLVPVRFDKREEAEGLFVPDDAVLARNDAYSLFRIDGDKVREVPVTLGPSEGGYRQVEGEGLTAGTQVVVRGTHYCFDGATVTVTATTGAAK